MMYVLIPLAVILAMGLLCLDVKAGFMVSDATEASGFSVGYYMMTVFGLIAAQGALLA